MPIRYLDEEQPAKVQFLDGGRDSTGEEILQFVAQDPSYAQRMTRDEFLQMRQFKEDNPVSFGTKVAEAFGGIGDILGKAFTTAPQFDKYAGPLEKVNSVVANIGQGATVGAGDFANMFLQLMEGYSNDNNSYNRYLVSNGLKNTPENKAKYNEVIDKELEGFRTLQNWQQARKELLGQASMPAAAEAISLVAQPPLPGAAALEALGVGERIGALGARAMQGVGKGIQGVGEATSAAARLPQQLAGMAASAMTGSEEAANRVEQMVARGSTGLAAGQLGLGLSVPGLSTTATAVAGAKAIGKGLEVAGEVTQKIAENAAKGASRIGTFESLANDLSASTAARTVGRLGSAVGGDIVAPYLAAATRGAAEGAAIGGVLGFITDGEDGAAGGIGSGLALGLGGGLAGNAFAQAKGWVRQGQIVGDAIRSNATLDPESRANASALFDRFLKDGHHEAVAEMVDTRNWLSGDVNFKYINDTEAKSLPESRGTSFEGITVLPKSDGTANPTVYINVDKVQPGTAFHEAFHGAMRTALGDTFGKRFSDLINATFTPEEKAKFAEEYVNRGGTDEGKQRLRDYLATGENMPEEMGAEYFRQFLQRRENRDLLLRGTRSADGSLIAATKSAIDFTLNRLGVTNDSANTGYKGMDALVNELVKARTDINKAIAENGKPVTTVPLDRMPPPKLIDWAQQQGQSDVLLKDPATGAVVGVKTEEQVNTGREAAYQRAAEDIANVPRGVNAPTDAELAIYGKHLPSDHVAKLTFLSEAMKRGNIINGDYFPASIKQGEQSLYASRGMTNRDFVPYKIRTTKKGVIVVDFLDVTQLKARFDEMMSRPGMLNQWGGNRDAAWTDVINYSRNLAQGEGSARPSAEIFGATKRDIINKVYGFVPTKAQLEAGAIRNLSSLGTNTRPESGTGKARIGKPAYQDSKDTRAVNSMRLDRIGKLVETKQSFPFNEEGSYGLSQVNFKPAEVLPHGKVYQSDEGYKIIGREGRFSLFDKDGQRVGIYGTAEEASKRVAALKAKTSFMPASPDTPAFKRWFGDSKVVNEQGKPMVVYHGTTAKEFDTFRPSTASGWGTGIYFTDNKSQAASDFGYGGRVVEAFVSIKNPYRGESIPDEKLRQTKAWKRVENKFQDPHHAWEESGSFVGDALRELGYDGVITKNSNDIDGLEIVAFKPEQVKATTNHHPTDSPNMNLMPAAQDAENSYRGSHSAPTPDSAPAHDLTGNGVYPKDVYQRPDWYETDEGLRQLRKVIALQGKPDEKVAIYRAIPTEVYNREMAAAEKSGEPFLNRVIRPGDWVTIDKTYAKEHGESALNGDFKVVAKRVPASHIFTNGDSIMEWGYHPSASGTNFMPEALSKISSDLERSGIKNDVSESGGLIKIHRMVVPPDKRNQGIGTSAMQQLADYADQSGKRIALSPSTDFGGSSVSRLKDFYRRFGFVENKGRNQDLAVSETMIREPKVQINFQPEAMPNGTVYRASNGYSVVNKAGAKYRVYSPSGLMIGVAQSLDDAESIIRRRK